MKKNRENSEHYIWGDNCSGWHLVDSSEFSVIEESMPSNTKEVKHYHANSQQFFYILRGTATFEIGKQVLNVSLREGIHIKPKVHHRIRNDRNETLEFLVISQPKIAGDRIKLD